VLPFVFFEYRAKVLCNWCLCSCSK